MDEFPSSILVLLCDSARREQTGKYTLTGYYGGDQILIAPGGPTPPVFPLSFVVVVKGGQGTFSATFNLYAPTPAAPIVSHKFPDLIKKPEGNHVYVLNFLTFAAPEFGEYRLSLRIGDKEFTSKFSITLSPKPLPA